MFLFLFFNFISSVFPAYKNTHRTRLEITAKKMEVFHKSGIIIAKGDVVINTQNFLVLAKEVRYEIKTQYLTLKNFKIFDFKKNAIAEGNEGFWDIRNDELWADEIFLFFKKEQIRIKAFKFHKNALNEYFAEKALVTTCKLECEEKKFPPWSLEIKNFVLTPEGISKGDVTKFKIKKLTMGYFPKKVYLPKVSLPLTVPRRTGFLTPHFVQGNKLGIGAQFPFFWPVTDQIDFTFSPLYLSQRGLIIDLENQFKIKKDFQGLIKFRYLKDFKKERYITKEEIRKDKWWIVSKIDWGIKPNLDAHLDIDIVSEKDFLEEFDVGENGYTNTRFLILQRFNRDIEDKTQEYRSSKFWLQYYTNSIYGKWENAYLDYHGSLDEDTILQPFLNFKIDLLPIKLFDKFLVDTSFTYLYNYREEGYYGQKINTEIGISYPFKFSVFSNLAQFKYNFDFYNLNKKEIFEETNITRNFFEISFNSYTTLLRYYKFLKLLHVLRPYIKYFYRPPPSKTDVPQFDYKDLISNKTHALEYGLWQFLNLSKQPNFLIIRAYQQYDFTKAKRSAVAVRPEEKPFSDLFFQILLNYSPYISARYDTTYNFYGLGFKKHSLTFNIREIGFDLIGITYQQDSAWNTKQISFDLRKTLFKHLWGRFYISRNLIRDETTQTTIEGRYLHDCYTVGLAFSITPIDTKFFFYFDLKGLGGYGWGRR